MKQIKMKNSTEADWFENIQLLFKQARKDLFYPPILKIEPAEVETIKVDLTARKHKLLVGRSIARHFSTEALLGILHHELNHWAKHPYDLKTIILEHSWLSGAQHRNAIRNIYDDVVVNLDLVINKGLEQVARVYRELPPGGRMDGLLRAFYSAVTGVSFGAGEIDADLEERITRLRAIDFLDLSRIKLKNNIKRFAEISDGLLDGEIVLPFTLFNLRDHRAEEILTAMEGIAKEVTPQEYQGIAAQVLEELQDAGLQLPQRGAGRAGISAGEQELLQELRKPDVSWYRSRARRYSVSIESIG